MKLSRYTSILKLGDHHSMVFAAMSHKFIIIRNMKIRDIDSLKDATKLNSELERLLIESQVLLEDDKDELVELKERIECSDNDPSQYILHINPTLDCNFRCWYCYEKHLEKSYMTKESVSCVKKFIKNKLEFDNKIKEFHLGFFGGEPLICFEDVVKPIINYSARECERHGIRLSIHFTSNGYLLNKDTIDYLSKYNVSFQITLDGNQEFHDKTRFPLNGGGSYDVIINNIKLLIKNKIRITIRINYTSRNVQSIQEITNNFEDIEDEYKQYFVFDFHRVWQEKENKDDETELIATNIQDYYRNEGYNVSAFVHKDVSQSCYGDKNSHILINYNLEAFGCTARDFTTEYSIGRLTKEGEIAFDSEKYNKRKTAKFSKEVCHNCRIAPLCGGGCRQKAYEAISIGNKCVYGYDEDDKDSKILDIFYQNFCTD